MYQFRIYRTTISQIIQDVCSASCKVLQPDFMKLLPSPQEWKAIADEGYRRWNISNCFGAADGEPITILKSKHSGSDFYLPKFLRWRSLDTYTPPASTDKIQTDGNIYNGTWYDEASSEFLCPLETTKKNQYRKNAEEIRTTYKDYFCGPGEVPWQLKLLI